MSDELSFLYVYDKTRYDLKKLKEALTKYNDEFVENGFAFGCLASVDVIQGINIREISHTVTKMEINDDSAILTIQILDTPRGNEVKEMYEKKNVFALKMRGYFEDNGDISILSFAITFITDEEK
jgi:hypothetical protein